MRPLYFLYLAVASIHLLAISFDEPLLAMSTKGVLMPVLIGYIYMSAARPYASYINWTIVALALSWLGDIALMFQFAREWMFLLGLSLFLLAHISYIVTFQKARWNIPAPTGMDHAYRRLRLQLFAVLLGLLMLTWIYPYLDDYALPVIIYTVVICGMAVNAAKRYGRTSNSSFQWVVGGAFLFLLSDSMLAVNKFAYAIPYERILVMATYIAAQYMIVKGIILHSRSEKNRTNHHIAA